MFLVHCPFASPVDPLLPRRTRPTLVITGYDGRWRVGGYCWPALLLPQQTVWPLQFPRLSCVWPHFQDTFQGDAYIADIASTARRTRILCTRLGILWSSLRPVLSVSILAQRPLRIQMRHSKPQYFPFRTTNPAAYPLSLTPHDPRSLNAALSSVQRQALITSIASRICTMPLPPLQNPSAWYKEAPGRRPQPRQVCPLL